MANDNPEISITPPEVTGFPLTKEFLELAFKKEVETFAVKLGTNPGDNFMSVIHAVDVTFKGEKDENHYLIKCYPNHPGRREFLDEVKVFEKEVFMYDDFLQQLQQLADENGAKEVGLLLPPYHGGNIVGSNVTTSFKDGPWANENFLIMTDLRKTLGCTMVDRTIGLDIPHAKLVLREIAKLHATSWAYKQKHGLALLTSKYIDFADSMYSNQTMIDSFKPVMDGVVANTLETVESTLGSEHPAYVNLKQFLSTDVMTLLREYLLLEGIDEEKQEQQLRIKPKQDDNYVKEPWLVCAHGDCWINNCLFRYDEQDPSKPLSAHLVDFQICREACPTTDLAYFLSCSVRTPIRTAHEDELLLAYYDAFVQYCEALHVKILPGFSFESLKRRYRRSKFFGLLLSLPLLKIVLKPPEEAIDLEKSKKDEDMVKMFSSVMVDSSKNNKYRDEMTASVLHLYEDGVI